MVIFWANQTWSDMKTLEEVVQDFKESRIKPNPIRDTGHFVSIH